MAAADGQGSPAPLVGAVLAGGRGSRLGQEKATIRIGGEPLLERTLRVLDGVCGRVLVVGRQWPGREWLIDTIPACGPVGGIATLLAHVGATCLVVPCDLPFLGVQALQALMAAHAQRPDGVLQTHFVQADGRQQNTVSIFEPGALEWFHKALREGGRMSLWRTIPKTAQYEALMPSGLERCFFNINTPADLREALDGSGQ